MRQIAYLVSSNVIEGRPGARVDAYEFTAQFAAIQTPARAAGFTLEPVVWDEPFDAARFDALVVGPAWDYWAKQAAFRSALKRWSSERPVLNPAPVIFWNMDKGYLRDLASLGAPVIETIWAEAATPDAIETAFKALDNDDLVIKPVVGAGAWRQARVKRGAALPDAGQLPPERAMIQAFLPSIASEGEYSFLFFGGQFSHAVVKRPASGDYRIQGSYGGVDSAHTPDPGDIVLARQCLEAACTHCGVDCLLYARVDMVRGPDDTLKLMEIELIEPFYYPDNAPGMGEVFARALANMLK